MSTTLIPLSSLVPTEVRTPLPFSPGISKSQAGALRCPRYLAGYYLQPRSASPRQRSTVMETGIAFHEYRADYMRHLRDTKQWKDSEFAEWWLVTHPVSEDAAILIRKDAKHLQTDPELINSVELFIVVNEHGEVIETVENHPPGVPSNDPRAFIFGQPDMLYFDGTTVTIPDYKSGYSTENVGDDEPKVYAALAFALFPSAQRVLWLWDYVRCGMERAVPFERSQLPAIWMRLRQLVAQKQEIIRQWNAGEDVEANPFSGHCRYCPLLCKQRDRAQNGELAIAPIRTEEEFRRLCGLIVGMQTFLPQATRLARQYLDNEQGGCVQLNEDNVAELHTFGVKKIALDRFLEEMGLALVDTSALSADLREQLLAQQPIVTPKYGVKLSSLTVGGTSQPARAKKRAGMAEILEEIATMRPQTRLRITKRSVVGEIEDITGLIDDIEAMEGGEEG